MSKYRSFAWPRIHKISTIADIACLSSEKCLAKLDSKSLCVKGAYSNKTFIGTQTAKRDKGKTAADVF